jgi:hypothetical protein
VAEALAGGAGAHARLGEQPCLLESAGVDGERPSPGKRRIRRQNRRGKWPGIWSSVSVIREAMASVRTGLNTSPQPNQGARMNKIDYKKRLRHLYNPSPRSVEIVDVPEMNFLLIDGQGDPNTSKDYSDAIEAVYAVSYALKFMVKKGEWAIDYGVMPLECLWWVDDMSQFDINDKTQWKWTSMIMQPEYVTRPLFSSACEQVEKKKNPEALPKIRFESFCEGKSVQTMHIGPFSEEGPTVELVHAFIHRNGYKETGKHHEIYLSDMRKAAPEKWRTVIRQPIEDG